MAEAITPTVENYLGLIYGLLEEGQPVIGARLAERLGVSRPTVTATLRRMERAGLIEMNERKEITLTPSGQRAARDLLRRHTLAEWLLHQVVGMPWHQVHEEADRLEHHFSGEAVARLDSLFEQPATCPHGNPMPGTEPLPAVPLDGIAEGEEVIVVRISEEAEARGELMAFLEENHLLPGIHLRVVSCQPYNETLTVQVLGPEVGISPWPVVLGLATARFIQVRRQREDR